MGAVPLLIALMVGLLILLALPIEVAFQVEGSKAVRGQITIRWLFGLVRFRVRIPGASPSAQAPQAATVRVKPVKQSGGPQVLALLRQAGFRQRVYRLAADLVGAAHLRRFRLRLRLGLGDPADTGRLWAVLGPLNVLAQNLHQMDVQIEAEFMEPVFEFQAQGRLLLVPLQFLVLVVGFALSPVSIRAWRSLKGRHA